MTDDVGLLLRRVAFGPKPSELAAARTSGYETALNNLISPKGKDVGAQAAPIPDLGPDAFAGVKPDISLEEQTERETKRAKQTDQVIRWWIDRMTVSSRPAQEKLIFFWHGHWATSFNKVRSPQQMMTQHMIFRQSTNFRDMAHKMSVDAALLYWLDGQLNVKSSPNENFARELMELFLLGIGNYSEQDVKEVARALTGWQINVIDDHATFKPSLHDNGKKTVLGKTGNFDVEQIVEMLLDNPLCPKFIATRLWFRFGSSDQPIPESTLAKMVAEFPKPMEMLRALFADEAFGATKGGMVKQPVEWFIGALRQLGLRLNSFPEENQLGLLDEMMGIGQLPFNPPNVGGWPAGARWLTSSAGQIRLRVAATLAAKADVSRLDPESLAYLLCLDGWTDRTFAVLKDVTDPRTMLTIGLASPEYVVT